MRVKSSMKINPVEVIMETKKEDISPLLFYLDAYPLPSGLSDFMESHMTLTPRSSGKRVDANILIRNPRPHVRIAGVNAAQATILYDSQTVKMRYGLFFPLVKTQTMKPMISIMPTLMALMIASCIPAALRRVWL